MKRIDTARAANAYGGPAGGTGHFQDTDPLGGTQFDAEWCEGMQEAVAATIEGLGGALAGDETGQLWGLLSPRVDGILSNIADTGTATNTHKRALVASSSSRASGINSAVVASGGCIASGADAALIASDSAIASGIGSFVAGSGACELNDAATIGGGTGAAVVASGANQQLTWKIDSSDGGIFTSGDVLIGCNVNTEATPKITLDGATGAITASAKVTAPGGLEIAGNATTAAWGGANFTATINEVGGKITVPFNAGPVPAALAGTQVLIVTNNKVDAGSRVKITCNFAGGNGFPIAHMIHSGAGFTVVFRNADPSNAIASDLILEFEVVNPA